MRKDGKSLLHDAYKAACRLGQADMLFWLLPALMALLVAGTLAQRWMGLYAAHKMFFGSFFFQAGPVPLPGGYLLTGFLTLFLACKFVLQSPWSRIKAGIALTHLGVLVLLGGGLLTALTAQESYLAVAQGAQTPYIYDYRQRELTAYTPRNEPRRADFRLFRPGDLLSFDNIPFTLRVISTCNNCAILKREEAQENLGDAPPRDMARFMALAPKPDEKEPDMNLSGMTFQVLHGGANTDGVYIAFEAMPGPIELPHRDRIYRIMFGKTQRTLPFSVRLDRFTRENHPGLDKARAYASDVTIIEDGLEWPARIEMNKPLRYKGYTFYQSSFEETAEGPVSIFSVVRNRGRLFPYLGTLLMTCGLLLHLFITMKSRRTP